ncbi:MAG: hypothetical protein CMJ52_03905 [Planctomycetaceae bacterium]|nr:hypothetical protein [Planctomycetaceae bacterium]
MTVLLAQSSQGADRLFADILPWLGLLVVIILVGGAVAMFLRRRFATVREETVPGFSLSDLRRMHESGELSEAEFTTAKSRMLESMKHGVSKHGGSPTSTGKPATTRGTAIPPVRRTRADADEKA